MTISALPGTLHRSPKMLNSIFAKTAGKRHLLRGRDVLIAEEDDGVIIVGVFDSGERLVVDGSGQVDTADLGAERGARRNNLDRHWRFSCW
jgi:hypothetical protein